VLLASRDLGHNGIAWSHLAGQAAIVVASLCYALAAVFTRRTLRGTPPLVVGFYTLAGASLETDILSLIFSRPPLTSLHPLTLFSVVWLGLLGSALGYILYFFIIESWGASRATLVTYMMPIVGLTLGAVVLSEVIDWRILVGSMLVVGGVVLASLIRRPARVERTVPTGGPAPVTGE
jgi:drug/metabolite transporter (DMT)-like permease